MKIAILTNKKSALDIIYNKYDEKRVFVLLDDFKEVKTFEKANIKKSKVVFVNLDSDTDKLVTILNIRRFHGEIDVMVSLDHMGLRDTFISAGVSFVLSKNAIASKLISSYIFEPEVASFNVDMLGNTEGDDDFDIQQFKVTQNNPYVDKTFGEMFADIRSKTKTMPIGVSKFSDGKNIIHKLPDDDLKINENDYIIFINNESSMDYITRLFKVNQGKDV